MVNTVNMLDTSKVEQAYEKRNQLYKFYINDLAYRALSKVLNRKDIDKITLDKVGPFSNYKETVDLAVITKFKEIKNLVNTKSKEAIFTLEPVDPSLVETNMDLLEKVYVNTSEKSILSISPVKKETVELVANTSFDLLDFVKNIIGDYAKEFISEVKAVISTNDKDVDDNIDVRFLEANTINEVIIENGVISKHYSGNIHYNFEVNYDSSDLIKAVLNTNYNSVDLNGFDMEIDSEFHKYLEELEDDHIEEFKEDVKSYADQYLTVKAFIDKVSSYAIPGLRDLQVLTYLWVAAINEYLSSKKDEYLEIAGYLEKLMNNTIVKVNNLEKNGTLAIYKKVNNDYFVYIVLKEYLKALEKQKDIINVIKGYVIDNPNRLTVTIDNLESTGYVKLKNTYNKYLANLNYKRLLSRISELRDAYIYGFMKSSNRLIEIIDKDYDKLDSLKRSIEEFVNVLKIDELVDVEETVYKIIRDLMFKDIIGTIESFIKLGEKRFPDNEDDAMVFAIIMTIVEVSFSLFRIKVLDRVE